MTGSRFRKNKHLLLTAAFFLVCLFSFSQTRNTNRKELEQKKKRITQEINELNDLLKENKTHKKNSVGALININIKLSKRQDLIRTITSEIDVINKEIRENENAIASLRASLGKLKAEYARMIVNAQKNQDSYSNLMFVLSSDDFNQAYARLRYIQQYADFRRKQAREIVSTNQQLTIRLSELLQKRREKNQLLGIEETEKNRLAVDKKEEEEMLETLQKKENDLKTELEQRKRDAVQLQAAIRKMIEAEIRKKAEEAEARRRDEAAKNEAAKKLARKKTTKPKKNPAGSHADDEHKTATNHKEETESSDNETTSSTESDETIALNEVFANNRGKLPWPVSKGVICGTYGEYEHPAIKGFMIISNGIEICAARGTMARAVFSGEVTSIAPSPTGGKLVLIRHGDYFSVYDHLDNIQVRVGQQVDVKQPLGTVLYDEVQDKTSLNFQIWKGRKTMDPSGWIVRAPGT